jgi:hypothetical protein
VSEEIEALRERVSRNPGSPEFPALVDALRRAGQLQEARRVALSGLEHVPDNVAGSVSLGLVMLETGDAEAARRELSRVLENVPGRIADVEIAAASAAPQPPAESMGFEGEEVAADEIERAIDHAESDPEQMLSANDIAVQAMEQAIASEPSEGPPLAFSPAEHPTYATETMAGLLERQGERSAAEKIRASIASSGESQVLDAAAAPEEVAPLATGTEGEQELAGRDKILATLESWLQNLRRGAA